METPTWGWKSREPIGLSPAEMSHLASDGPEYRRSVKVHPFHRLLKITGPASALVPSGMTHWHWILSVSHRIQLPRAGKLPSWHSCIIPLVPLGWVPRLQRSYSPTWQAKCWTVCWLWARYYDCSHAPHYPWSFMMSRCLGVQQQGNKFQMLGWYEASRTTVTCPPVSGTASPSTMPRV